jgi:NAD(P)-dependent dehydrogenase (short-subunit alcohol dehydrogenase family)
VTLVARGDATIGRAAVERLIADGAVVVAADEARSLSGDAARECVDVHGRLDVLVVAPADAPFDELVREASVPRAAHVDDALRTAFFIVQSAVRSMADGGRICIAAPRRPASIGRDLAAPATSIEGGLIAMVRLIAVEVAPAGIRVNGVCPIAADADAVSVAATLAFLSANDASYVSGVFVPVVR